MKFSPEIWRFRLFWADNYSVLNGVYLHDQVKRTLLTIMLLVGICFWASAQIAFIENRGQWPDQVNFRADLPSGSIYAEDHALTFSFIDPQITAYLHPSGQNRPEISSFRGHHYKLHFAGSTTPFVTASKGYGYYHNYYIGQDSSKWADHCEAFQRFDYQGLYEHIDMSMYTDGGNLKYDFIVHPGGDPRDIAMVPDGVQFKLEETAGGKELVIVTSVGVIREKAPFAYQILNGNMIEVNCEFVLKNGQLKFQLAKYDKNAKLVIDPEIAFSTYIGSTANNFGFTACDDTQGNLISGATVFADGYPITTGAFSTTLSGIGSYDAAITKFNADGSQLLYSTYIGGSGNETPHSVVADGNDNFIVMGVTGSDDYPTTAGAFQQTFNGGPFLDMFQFFVGDHNDGCDLFLAKFNADGTLSSSTFIGGSNNDGLNYGDQLYYNYGDSFRGEVNVDAANNVFVASVTESSDFPINGNGPQNSFGGGSFDGVVFKMNPALSTMLWGTFVGGSSDDATYAIEFRNDGALVIAGGTKSSNFPLISGGADMSHNGQTDGYISVLDEVNFNLLSGTLTGTSEYDQVYFVQVDDADNIYGYGQTEGNMTITAGCYGQANSGQFISKYNSTLSSLTWNTTIGTSSGEIDISPTAFLVSDCEQIYISGWGGEVNTFFCQTHDCYAEFSTTDGLPITADAFQTSTDGSDFYLCVLNPNATGLLYASYLGGDESGEHVDGGTSRFDKNGSVFQAVCAGCQNNDDFPTTPDVWSNTNESSGCNIAVFRFDLNAVQAHVDIDGPDQICIGSPVNFINNTVGATSYLWIFGDGETSDQFEPTHIYDDPGVYTIQLIGMDDALCVNADTAEVTLTILPGVEPTIDGDDLICQGDQVTLTATGSENLHWLPATGITNTTALTQTLSPNSTSTYTVIDFNDCDADTLIWTVEVSIPDTDIGDDVSICAGNSTTLNASGGVTYLWSPSAGLNANNVPSPLCSATQTTDYTVTITTTDDCVVEENVTVTVFLDAPGGNVYDPLQMCEGASVQLTAVDATSWLWSPASSLNNPQYQNPMASPADTTTYVVVITNSCGSGTDQVTVNVIHPDIEAWGGGSVCIGDSIAGYASGALQYYWQPAASSSPSEGDTVMLHPGETTWFEVTGVDIYNCHAKDSVYVYVFPTSVVDAGPDQYYAYPDSAVLLGNAFGLPFYWWPSDGLSCIDCIYPVANPLVPTWYHLAVIDDNGCVSDDSVYVKPYFPIWVPNTVTPNEDGINDVFKAYGVNIEGFHLRIFDRWGLKIFEATNIDDVWVPSVTGDYYVQNDVYTWVIQYDSIERREELIGHVTVVR